MILNLIVAYINMYVFLVIVPLKKHLSILI